MRRIVNAKKPNDAGQAAVEFALAFVIFVPILFFILDFGWITFQKVSFEYGYMHASWEISASDFKDDDPLETTGNDTKHTYPCVNELHAAILNSTAGLIDSNLVVVDGAEASFQNEEDIVTPYSVPGRMGVAVPVTTITRYMKLTAELKYTIQPLTPIWNIFFKDPITLEKDFTRMRVVKTQHRSQ